MNDKQIDSGLFKRNRKAFSKRLLPGSVAVINPNDEYPRNGDQCFSYRQHSDLFYLTGIDQENTRLILAPDFADEKYQEIAGYREYVPKQCRAEVWPDAVRVRKWEEVTWIKSEPNTTYVEDREQARTDNREDRHRFRRTVDRSTPLLSEETEDRGDQSTGMTDTDPEYEVNDRPTPVTNKFPQRMALILTHFIPLTALLAIRSTAPGAISFSHCPSFPRVDMTTSRLRFSIALIIMSAASSEVIIVWPSLIGRFFRGFPSAPKACSRVPVFT